MRRNLHKIHQEDIHYKSLISWDGILGPKSYETNYHTRAQSWRTASEAHRTTGWPFKEETQDGRDMWRILAVEEIYGCRSLLLQMCHHLETAARYSDNRHFQCDWNGRHLCNELEGHVFGQIFVDYLVTTRMAETHIMASLPSLVLQPEIF
jgi:hypothetical protein